MKILLDENFPLQLYHRLRAAGYDAEHIIVLELRGQVIVSRVRQNLPISRRVDIWFKALQEFMTRQRDEKLFDLLETGQIVPWEVRKIE